MTPEQEIDMEKAWKKSEWFGLKKCLSNNMIWRCGWKDRQPEIDALTAERDALRNCPRHCLTMCNIVEQEKSVANLQSENLDLRAERNAAEAKVAELQAIIKELNEDGLLTADLKCANSGKYWYILDDEDCRRVSSLFKGGEDEREELKDVECPKPGNIVQVDQTWEDGRTYAYELSPGFWEQSEDCFLPEDWGSIRYMYSTREAAEAAMGGGK